MKTPTLTEKQDSAVSAIKDWLYEGKSPFFRLAGYAGTGKTTLLSQLVKEARDNAMAVAVAAFMGKAASVLRNKGILDASTIHSLIYDCREDETGKMIFVRKDAIPATFVVIDESSTVNQQMHEDLLQFRVPILYVGDNAQLKPIGEDAALMDDPDFVLDEVHRQAWKSPIIRYATNLRERVDMDTTLDEFKGEESNGLAFGGWDEFVDAFDAYDQCICGFNKTRLELNRVYRKAQGYTDVLLPGERIICLKNNQKLGVFNGMVCTVVSVNHVNRSTAFMDVETELGMVLKGLPVAIQQFGNGKQLFNEPGADRRLTYWDYAYVITGHKSQGSEWKSVAVYEETVKDWDVFRWRYTTATRASEKLLYCM